MLTIHPGTGDILQQTDLGIVNYKHGHYLVDYAVGLMAMYHGWVVVELCPDHMHIER